MICIKKTASCTLSLVTIWSAAALAQPSNNGPQPPPEAYTACEGKQQGEKASLTDPQGHTISGTCERQMDGRLFLIPDRLGRGEGNGRVPMIPPQAYESCMGKKLGDSVQLSIPGGLTISGTCQSDGERLYLRPDGPPPGMKLDMDSLNDDQSPSPEHAEFDEERYQEPRTDAPTDTPQQAPGQEEDDNSSGYQQQSPPPKNMHSDAQQQEQQSDPTNSVDQAPEQQSPPPAQQPVETPQEKPKGFVEKAKDFWRNLW